MTGAVASERVTEAPKGTLRMDGNHSKKTCIRDRRSYMEKILCDANRRFRDMSNGQFELKLINVEDAGEGLSLIHI